LIMGVYIMAGVILWFMIFVTSLEEVNKIINISLEVQVYV
jgi:hypothetical protein